MAKPLAIVSLKYGLAGGVFSILVFVILWLIGKNPLVTNRIYDFLLIPLFVFFSVKEFRDVRNGGVLHFWQGIAVGVFTFVTMALVSALFIWLFLEFANSGLLQNYIDTRIGMINENKEALIDKLGESTVVQTLNDLPHTSAFKLGEDDFLKKIFIGSFFTAIIALVLRKHASW
jgi:hypothetical protein